MAFIIYVSSLFFVSLLQSCMSNSDYLQTKLPTVTITVLVRNKAHTLPYFFSCLEALDYPKDRIFIWIYSDYNSDNSADLIDKWYNNYGMQYNGVNITIDKSTATLMADESKPHEWSESHFKHVIKLRQEALEFARKKWSQFLFMIDADVFLTATMTLKLLVSKNLPISSPMLVSDGHYSNFWAGMDENYYYKRTENYQAILSGDEIGCFNVPMVHTAVLVNLFMLGSDKLTYDSSKLDNYKGPEDDIITFAVSAKQNSIPLMICNDYEYGYVPVPLERDDDQALEMEQLLNVKLEALSGGNPILLNSYFESDVKYPEPTRLGLDAIYLINLKRREERRTLMEQSFKELGLDVTYFEAIDGRNLNKKVLDKYNIKLLPNYEDPHHKRPMKTGEIGCFLSHYLIWEEMVKTEHKTALILEDDLHFVPYFLYKFHNLLKELDHLKWDLVYIGRKYIVNQDEIHVSKHLVKPLYSYWTLGYLLSLEGANKLLNAKPLEKILPVDEFLPIMFNQHPNKTWKSHFLKRNLIAYSANPLLVFPTLYVGQDGYISDTEDSVILDNGNPESQNMKTEL